MYNFFLNNSKLLSFAFSITSSITFHLLVICLSSLMISKNHFYCTKILESPELVKIKRLGSLA